MKSFFPFLLLFIFPQIISAQLPGTWSEKTDMPTARKEVANAAVSLDGEIYVVGGRLAGNAIGNMFEKYDPATDTWETLAPYPMNIWRTTAAAADGKIYVFGGYQIISPFPFNPSDKVYMYDPATDEWTARADMLSPRGASAAVYLNGNIHLVGGGANSALNTHHIYDPANDEWTAAANLNETRSGLTANAVNGKIYAFGGYHLSGGVVSRNTVEEYDPATDEWNFVADIPTAKLGISSAVLFGRIYIFGGETNASVPTKTLEYFPEENTWRQMATTPEPVNFAGAATVGDTIYIMGGGEVNLTPDGIAKNFCFNPELPVSTNEIYGEKIKLHISPNPISDFGKIKVKMGYTDNIDLEIMDIEGRIAASVFSGKLNTGTHFFEISKNGFLKPGIYFIRLDVNGVYLTEKFILN